MRRTGVLLAVLALSACGSLEWPPPGRTPGDLNRPLPERSKDSVLFVGARAVVVGTGDTVYALARRHRVSMRAIIEANGLVPPYHLAVGQRIVLPHGRAYRVQKGDTLYGLARRFRVDPYRTARLNALVPPYTIRIGQRLTLPASAATPSAKQPANAATTAKPARETPSGTGPADQPKAGPSSPPPAAPSPADGGEGFIWPLQGTVVSRFGPKPEGRRNDGINIAAPRGAPVRAAADGMVAYAGNELRGFGNLLLIKHRGGWVTAYAHNDTLLVGKGDRVRRGQTIATVGSTGSVRTPQLHFELRRGRDARNPERYLVASTRSRKTARGSFEVAVSL